MPVKWVVLLRTEHGVSQIPIEADSAERDEDAKTVEFRNLSPLGDVLDQLRVDWNNATPEQLKTELLQLFRNIGKVSVASFKEEVVIGFYQAPEAAGN